MGTMCRDYVWFRLYCLANIPFQYMTLDWNTFPNETVRDQLFAYLECLEDLQLEGIGFEFYGRTLGVGKTFAGTFLLKEIVKAGYSGYFITFADIKNLMNESTERRAEVTARMMESDFLMIDEIIEPLSEKQRAFFEEKLEWVVRSRAAANMPTITTTNLLEEDMIRHYPRVHSVLSGHQQRIELQGKDYRITRIGFNDRAALALKGERRPLT